MKDQRDADSSLRVEVSDMAAMVKINIIADSQGRIVAAELSSDIDPEGDGPTARVVPMNGLRVIRIDIPAEVLELSGPNLHRFFSEVQVTPDRVQLPKVKIVRGHEAAGSTQRRKRK